MRINRAQLLRALRHAVACSSATAKGSGVTACALLASSGSILTVTATDYDVTGTATAP